MLVCSSMEDKYFLPAVLQASVSPGGLPWPCPWLCLFCLCFAAALTLVSVTCVCVGLISSGCVSHHSGLFTGLPAVPGIGGRLAGHPARPPLRAAQNKAEPHPLVAL